jgi:hypothetical protein
VKPKIQMLLILLLTSVLAVTGCNPAPIAGDYGGPTTPCEDSIAAAQQNPDCGNDLTDWVVSCSYNNGQCLCTALQYELCADVLSFVTDCGPCPQAAEIDARKNHRNREADTIHNLVAKLAGESIL